MYLCSLDCNTLYIIALKLFKRIVTGIAWTLIVLYTLLIVLLHVPAIQGYMGTELSSVLQEKLGTRVTVGKINLGFLNRVIIDDVTIYDKSGHAMIRTGRLSAKIDYYLLVRGYISISSAQIFGLKGIFYKKDAKTEANFQFLANSLSSDNNTVKQPVNLRINSLVIRNGAIRYDRYDIPVTRRKLNLAHINVKDISAHLFLPAITNKNIDVVLKNLSLKEESGLEIKNMSFDFHADRQGACIRKLSIRLPQSEISSSSICSTYKYVGDSIDTASIRYSGNIKHSYITLCDIGYFISFAKGIKQRFNVNCTFSGNDKRINVTHLDMRSSNNLASLALSGFFDYKRNIFRANIAELNINEKAISEMSGHFENNKEATELIKRLGSIALNGIVESNGNRLSASATVKSEALHTKFHADIDGSIFNASADIKNIDLQRMTGNSLIGSASADIVASGRAGSKGIETLRTKGHISSLEYNGYRYSNIQIDGQYGNGNIEGVVAMNDPNGTAEIRGNVDISGKDYKTEITAKVRDLVPSALNITSKWPGTAFSTDISLHTEGNSIDNITGKMSLANFQMKNDIQEYRFNKIDIEADNQHFNAESDFGHMCIDGNIKYTALAQSITNIIGSKLPTLPNLPPVTHNNSNNFNIWAEIHDTKWLEMIFGIPLEAHSPISVKGRINDNAKSIDMVCLAPHIAYNGNKYENIGIDIKTLNDTISACVDINKMMDSGKNMAIHTTAIAANNTLATSMGIKLNQKRPIEGIINTETQFFKTENNISAAHIHVRPSQIMLNDTAWHVLPSDIVYSKKNIIFDNFAIEHNNQHIRINGLATENAEDSVILDLNDIDVSYILNLVNFHSVEFSGLASGRASIKSAFKNADASASITVNDFKFEGGRMGTLFADVKWNKNDRQIDINAVARESNDAQTLIDGYVSPERNYIDLGISAHNTNIEFLESFCGSFMEDVRAHTNGKVRLYGDLSEINLIGQLVADGSIKVSPLNTTYRLESDTIRLIPDKIIFRSDSIRDRNGNIGIVNGTLSHKHLTRLTYNLNINAYNLLCYDFKSYGNNTFYGTVFGTGTCKINGGNGRIGMDVNITPEKGSFIEYNATSPDAITNRQFITWNSKNTTGSTAGTTHDINDSTAMEQKPADFSSDMHINFLFNTNDNFTLRVLMDNASGDHISLNGNGSIHASFYNKGAFNMFGSYNISRGVYKLTIQNIIKKEFTFQQGSSIVFGGDPYHAALNLKALYTINGVSLADLQIGRSFSGNNVRVDCIMNITGTPQAPHVDFDIDLPTVNSDAKQMVRSLINSEEEMNQQVIYLLGIGRFYAQNTNNADENNTQASQTSLAMQSLLSGTISQQINSLLSSFIKSNNWNFGANISTGNEGFNNAEYEGILTGRLLDNRLIINGQFGYRDNANATTSFIGDFDVRYLLYPNGNLAVKVYNQTNDRYFTKSSLNTQGIGIIMKKDFGSWKELFKIRKK